MNQGRREDTQSRSARDEPRSLPTNACLIVTVRPETTNEAGEFWSPFSADGLARAYGDDEAEYSDGDVVRG